MCIYFVRNWLFGYENILRYLNNKFSMHFIPYMRNIFKLFRILVFTKMCIHLSNGDVGIYVYLGVFFAIFCLKINNNKYLSLFFSQFCYSALIRSHVLKVRMSNRSQRFHPTVFNSLHFASISEKSKLSNSMNGLFIWFILTAYNSCINKQPTI